MYVHIIEHKDLIDFEFFPVLAKTAWTDCEQNSLHLDRWRCSSII